MTDRPDYVAAVAVQEAVERQAPVRFLQVVPAHLDDEARSIVEEALFRAGLHALRGHPRTARVFEVVPCRPSAVVGWRSRAAALVVVGASNEQALERQSLADRRARAAGCPSAPCRSSGDLLGATDGARVQP